MVSKGTGVIIGVLGFLVLVFLLAFGLTRLLCSPVSWLTILDHPNERSLHRRPTPRTGGVAIMGALYVGVLTLGVLGWIRPSPEESMFSVDSTGWWILVVTGVISIVSLMDDRRGLSIGVRLVIHLLAATLLVIGASLVLPPMEVPMLGPIRLGWAAVPITVVFLVWMANLYNFMDGMDGFAGGMTTLGCGFLAYFAWKAGHDFILVSALLLSVASAGFLVHNFPPAKIFMGDVGSVTSGFMCGALIILGCRDRVFDFWVPVILFSPFILDATATLVGRVWQREKIWVAHRTHYYQRLVLSGWGHRKAVLAEYAVMALCGGFALLYQYASEEWRLVILGFWGMLFLSLALAVRGVEQRIQQVAS